jgi:flagellar biosynthesis/type III secretory pathway M-ring protein FliF/YscJ
MERFRKLFEYLQAQLGVLSVSQRIAIGLCAALIAGSFFWLMQWSSSPEYVPVLNHEFALTELSAAEDSLRSAGISFQVMGTRLYVRSADRYTALRVLHSGGALPEGSLLDMAAVIGDDHPFQSPEAREYAQNYAKGNELAKILSTYPSVQKAAVLINPVSRRRLGGAADVPTASVTVTLAPGKEMTFEMVEAVARLVSGAVAGLKPYNVTVVDGRTIRSFAIPRPDEAGHHEHFRVAQRLEERLLEKIRGKLANIPGVLASVTVELDTSKRTKRTNVHEPAQPRTETRQTNDQASGDGSAEPGVQANVGQAVTGAAAGSRTTMEESSVENFEPKLRESETVEQGPTVKKVTAAVGIPRSFLVGVYRAKYPEKDKAQDDDPNFIALRDDQVARVKSSVERIVMAKSASDVTVDVYPDVDWGESGPTWQSMPGDLSGGQMVQAGPGPDEWIGLLRGYGPPAGLGLLAMLSLGLMLRVVRKSAEVVDGPSALGGAAPAGPAVSPVGSEREEPVLLSGMEPVGQAAAPDGFLVGKEVTDATLRYQELSREVSRLINADPAAAAEMLRQWIEQD